MDAQNAAGPDETKSAAAASEPLSRPDHAPADTSSTPPAAPAKPIVDDPRPSPVPEKVPEKDAKPSARSSVESSDDRNGNDANSDAETIVLPGKDGHSPSKIRKVKHEDKSDHGSPSPSAARVSRDKEEGEREHTSPHRRDADAVKDHGKDGAGNEKKESDKDRERDSAPSTTTTAGPTDSPLSQAIKRKRRLFEKPLEKTSLPPRQPNKDSPVSTPTSPPTRKSIDAYPLPHSDSNSDTVRYKPPKAPKNQLKGAEALIPHKRKAPRLDSEDEDEIRKARRQRTAPASTNPDSHPHKQPRDHQQKPGPNS
ncbi:hypothetical protein IMZ48_46110, partial [Candidatus Bathyarchaeota archaeon]|nr:hypothetical protein [Candidatus Bathyarchaeota archaeon]